MKPEFVFALDNAAWPVLVLDDAGKIQRANQAAAMLLGVTPEGGTPAAAMWSNENEQALKPLLDQGQRTSASPFPLLLRTKAGTTVAFDALLSTFRSEGCIYCLVQLTREASRPSGLPLAQPSERQGPPLDGPNVSVPESAANAALAQKQKLECALQLTRTVALDFNNALTSILGHTSLVLSKMEPNHPWRNSLVEVEKSAGKAAEVASDLAAFSRQEKDTRSQVAGNLNELVRRTVELFQKPSARLAIWSLQLEPRLYTVIFDEAKMQQAFVKVLDNAVQAIPEEGRITVRTRNQDVTGSLQDENIRLAQGHYVCVEFEDSGCGIAPQMLARVFEPFFSTKQAPSHRGLGLAWVYGIVTNHGGSVAIASQVGQGSTVRIYLPAQAKIVRDLSFQRDELSGSQTILMVDDEELLLTMGEMVLSSFGYRVLTANSGQKALELFLENADQIDVVITDLVMPKMSGRELIGQLRQLAPNLKIICSSGYIRALNADEEELYLQKPFTSLDLLRKVKEALTGPEGS